MDFRQFDHSPRTSRLNKIDRKKLVLPIVVLILALIITVVFTKNPQLLKNLPFVSMSTSVNQPIKESVFDIPSLVGKNIDQIQKDIGPSIDKQPEELPKGTDSWRLTFRKGGNELVVTYDIKTGKATAFSLATDDPKGNTTDKTRLLNLGNLQEESSSYEIVFVKTAEDPNKFTAIKVLPK